MVEFRPLFIDRKEHFSAIEFIENPRKIYCDSCKDEMVLRHKKTDINSKFYGCSNFPDCRRTKKYRHEDKLAFVDYYKTHEKDKYDSFTQNFCKFKYVVRTEQIKEQWAEKFYIALKKQIDTIKIDFCTSIPDSNGEENWIIGMLFEYIKEWNYLPHIVEQKEKRKSQKDAGNAKARWENVKGAYALRDAEAVRGSKILLLDDIVTTGASMDEVSKVLFTENRLFCYAASVGKTI